MKKEPMLYPEEEEPRRRWPIVVSRIVSGAVFMVGFIWAAGYFAGNELVLSIIIMLLPMAMIWYPEEIDNFGKGGYGEGGASHFILAAFGWVCLLLFLVIIGLRAEGFF